MSKVSIQASNVGSRHAAAHSDNHFMASGPNYEASATYCIKIGAEMQINRQYLRILITFNIN
jgi:hypothetical protein